MDVKVPLPSTRSSPMKRGCQGFSSHIAGTSRSHMTTKTMRRSLSRPLPASRHYASCTTSMPRRSHGCHKFAGVSSPFLGENFHGSSRVDNIRSAHVVDALAGARCATVLVDLQHLDLRLGSSTGNACGSASGTSTGSNWNGSLPEHGVD